MKILHCRDFVSGFGNVHQLKEIPKSLRKMHRLIEDVKAA
jgi:hypothetical protein